MKDEKCFDTNVENKEFCNQRCKTYKTNVTFKDKSKA